MFNDRPRGIRPRRRPLGIRPRPKATPTGPTRRPRGVRPVTASDVFHPIVNIQPGDVVLVVARCSTRRQKSGLKAELEALENAVTARGARPVVDDETSKRIGRGYDGGSDAVPWSKWLRDVAAAARHHGCNKILAETVDRFVRHPRYHRTRQHHVANMGQLWRVRRWTAGFNLVTLADPSASPGANRAVQTRRGIEAAKRSAAKKKAGDKKRFNLLAEPRARELRKRDWEPHEVRQIINFKYGGTVTRQTVWRWIKDVKPET